LPILDAHVPVSGLSLEKLDQDFCLRIDNLLPQLSAG
jgi:hypothetical protein